MEIMDSIQSPKLALPTSRAAMFFLACLMAFAPFAGAEGETGTLLEVNRVLGLQVFDDNGWQGEAGRIMRRLNAYYETTQVQDSTVYSSYSSALCAGARYYQVKIRAVEGSVEELEFVFANKGDSVNKKGEKVNDQVRKFQQKLQEDAKTVRKRLSEAFGKPTHRGDDTEWMLSEAMIVLTVSRKEFMKLSILPPILRRQTQVQERRKVRSVIKENDFTENLTRNEFGDVFIKNVPMVDQGPKGYCGPATIERCLLYYGIEGFDQHELAEKFDTGKGGGTRISRIIDDTGRILRKYGVEMSTERIRLKGIRQAIDNGYPVFRHLFTDEEVSERMNYVTHERQGKTVAQWTKTLSKLPPVKKAKQTNHFNLVIGYNEKTQEIAISDSWGNFAQLRWIPWKDFENTTFHLYVVRPK